jgi:hypothetical protein
MTMAGLVSETFRDIYEAEYRKLSVQPADLVTAEGDNKTFAGCLGMYEMELAAQAIVRKCNELKTWCVQFSYEDFATDLEKVGFLCLLHYSWLKPGVYNGLFMPTAMLIQRLVAKKKINFSSEEVSYNTIRQAAMEDGWFYGSYKVIRQWFPTISDYKLREALGACGAHPPVNPDHCDYQGYMSFSDFQRLLGLLIKEASNV